MKTFALISLFALSACGSNDYASQTKNTPDSERSHSLYSFMVDAREVDGNYQKLTIKLDEQGTYVASMRTITAGEGFPVSDTTEVLDTQLECKEEKTKQGKLDKLFCARDNRPADGYLIELTILRNESKRYDVIMHKNAYPQIAGSAGYDEVLELSYAMIRQN